MNRSEFQKACKLLWGDRYVSEFARTLEVSPRQAIRYHDGTSAIPEHFAPRLAKLLAKHKAEIEKTLAKLEAAG